MDVPLHIPYFGYVEVSIDMASIVTTCGGRMNVLMLVCPDTTYTALATYQ